MLGIGGGFLMVPALIYLFRVPTAVVVGTSLFQILFTMVAATMLHAVTNQSVDVILAHAAGPGRRLRRAVRRAGGPATSSGEHFRLLLALIVLAVGVRFAAGDRRAAGRAVLARRRRSYADGRARLQPWRARLPRWPRALAAAGLRCRRPGGDADPLAVQPPRPASPQTYTGAELVIFGVIDARPAQHRRGQGPMTSSSPPGPAAATTVVREKVRFGPIWMNLEQRKFVDVPVDARRALDPAHRRDHLARTCASATGWGSKR